MKTKSPLLRIDRLLVAFAILTLCLAPHAQAQTNLVTWGVNGTTNQTSVGTSSVATGVVATSISQGPGVVNASLANAINGNNWTNTSQALALTAEDYFEFTIAPEANYVLTFSGLNANLRRSSTGPANAAWVYSLDDYGSNLASTNSVSTATGGANLAVSLSDTGITEAVTFRLTAWGSANSGGTLGIRATSSGANPTFNGTATLRSAASLVWDGGRGSGGWTAYNATDANQANWGGNNTPLNGDTLLFAGSTQTNTTNTVTSLLANAIVFSNTAGTFAVSGNALTVSNGITNLSANAQVFSNEVSLGAAQTFNASAGNLTFAGNVVNAGNALTVDGSANTAISGALSGVGGLVKSGAGTLTLGGANSYSGGTLVSAGRLVGDTTSLQGTLTNDAAVTFNQSADGTYGSVMSGTGSLTKSGAGTLTMTAINTFGGATTISAGELVVDGTNASSAVTVSSGGSLGGTGEVGSLSVSGLLAPGNSVGTLSAGATTFNTGGSFELEMYDWTSTAGTGWDLLGVTGDLTLSLSGAGAFTINLVSLESSTEAGFSVNFNQTLNFTNTFVSFSGDLLGTTFEAGLFAINTSGFQNAFSGVFSITNITGGLALVYTAPEIGAEFEWNAGAGNWNTAGNWTNNSVPPATGANIYYSGAGGLSTNDVATAITGLTFRSGAGAYTLEGDALTLDLLGIVNESTALQTVNLNLTLAESQFFTATSGNLVIGGSVALGVNTLTVSGAEDTSVTGAISGDGGLVKTGAGNLTLGGLNTYSGGTLVSGGRLIGTTTSLQGGITNASFLEFSQSTNGTYAGIITGAGAVVKSDAGNVTFSGANDYEGGTLVDGGTLTGSTSSMPGAVEVSSAATFAISQATNGTFSGLIEGEGRFVKDGSGDVTLAGVNTYSGGTLVSAGTLTGTASSLQGAITNNAAVVFVQTPDGTYGGAMSGSGSLTQSGTGTLTLSGANTYVGGTTVSSGTLAGTTGSLQGDIANSGTVRFDQTTTGSYSGELSGGGALVKAGSGAVTLEGANTYTGATTVEGGSLIAANNNSLSSSAVTMSDGSVLAEAGVTLANSFTIGTAAVVGSTTTLQSWNLTGINSPATAEATFVATGLDTDSAFNTLTRGAGAAASSANNSFRTAGFQNNGISLDNTDFFQWSLSSTANSFSLGTLDARFAGTATFAAAPGVSAQFAFSTDGVNFTLIGSPFSLTSSTAMPQIDLTAISALQGLAAGTEVTFRYFASGQTTTGGWGFNSPNAGSDALVLQGALTTPGSGSGTLGISETGSATFSGNVAVNNTSTFTAATGGQATFGGVVSGPSTAGITKTGAGTVTLSGSSANTFTGTTTVSAGTLELAKTADTTAIAGNLVVSSGATLLLSESNQVNSSGTTVSLSGGTITRASGVSEVFGNLNLTAGSFLDYGAGDVGTLSFGTYTPSALLTVSNFFEGNVLTFGTDLSGSINNGSLFSFDNGFTTGYDGSTFTITAIPEPSTYAAAAGLLVLMLWPARKRLLKDAKKILGFTPPMRDRLAAKRIRF